MTLPPLDLNAIWFVLVGVLLTGYVMLDGFDLGVGILHRLAPKDGDRRIFLNAIGPVWDGNEVWLVAGGGALFAAFPKVYATVFSGFYLAFMLLLFALILRAVSIEFRSKQPMDWWRGIWDFGFSAGSLVAAFLLGVAAGNLAAGIPLGADGEFRGGLSGLLGFYPMLAGVTAVALFMMHGAVYLLLKTEGGLQDSVRRWAKTAFLSFILCYLITAAMTLVAAPHLIMAAHSRHVLIPLFTLTVAALFNVRWQIGLRHDGPAFFSSCAAILSLTALFGAGMFPNMVFSNPDPQLSLTAYNAASSPKTLSIMLVIALTGMPLILAYTAIVYRIFRGKVKLDHSSY